MRVLLISILLLTLTLVSKSLSSRMKSSKGWLKGRDDHTLTKFDKMYCEGGEIKVTRIYVSTTKVRAQRKRLG